MEFNIWSGLGVKWGSEVRMCKISLCLRSVQHYSVWAKRTCAESWVLFQMASLSGSVPSTNTQATMSILTSSPPRRLARCRVHWLQRQAGLLGQWPQWCQPHPSRLCWTNLCRQPSTPLFLTWSLWTLKYRQSLRLGHACHPQLKFPQRQRSRPLCCQWVRHLVSE